MTCLVFIVNKNQVILGLLMARFLSARQSLCRDAC